MTNEPNSPPGPTDEAIQPAAAPSPPVPTAASDASTSTGLPAWLFQFDLVLLALLLVLSFFLASFSATNSDLWMSLAVGKKLSEGEYQFGVDPFSWATEANANVPAVYWVNHGWLSSWFAYKIFVLFGPHGGAVLVALKAAMFTATIALLSRLGWNDANRWFVIICLAIAALAISPRLLLQPTVISFFFLALTLYILNRAGVFFSTMAEEEAKPGCLWWLPLLFGLWANLDQWFILGPIMLLLCCLATAIANGFSPALVEGTARPLPLQKLALVFGVSVLACLANPHHIYVFQMPAELAYLVLSLRVPLPDALAGGGRTLQLLHQTDPDYRSYAWTIPSVTSSYYGNPALGKNIAGVAFFPLLILGILAFTVTALIRPQPGSPVFHIHRFTIWLAFAMMAVASHRMIPFFVLVAAPLTAMTLGEFMLWQNIQADSPALRRDRGLRLARLFSLPFMLMLLFLAWPGWLHGTTDFRFNSPRHVAWDVRPDGSLKEAAETLHRLKLDNACANVFNVAVDFPPYCAWFAPGVKCGFDTRFALFPAKADIYLRTRKAVQDPINHEPELHELFAENNIDQAVLGSIGGSDKENLLYWWIQADQWRCVHADQRVRVFSWAGADKHWPINSNRNELNRQAFGDVPPRDCPPAGGTMQPQQLDLWDLYLQGVGPTPAAATEAEFLRFRFFSENQFYIALTRPCGLMMSAASMTCIQGLPGNVLDPSLLSYLHKCSVFGLRQPAQAEDQQKQNTQNIMWWTTVMQPLDFGSPALPVLAMRAARRAVAENPLDLTSQQSLLEACDTMRSKQEDYWAGYYPSGQHPSRLRDRLRQTQINAGMYSAVLLPMPRLIESFQTHERLAQHYLRLNLLDLAVDQMYEAERALTLLSASDEKNAPKEAEVRHYREMVVGWQKKVQLRDANWKENAGKLDTSLKKAIYAYAGNYQEARGEQMVPTRLGLAKKALEILNTVKTSSLEPNELLAYFELSSDILLLMGRINEVAETLRREDFRDRMPPHLVGQYEAIVGGALGDYEMMDRGLQLLEKGYGENARKWHSIWLASMHMPPTMLSSSTMSVAAVWRTMPPTVVFAEYAELLNVMTLRGIAALEAGDTKKARDIFQQTMDRSGNVFGFSDRQIARRYLELLNEQR